MSKDIKVRDGKLGLMGLFVWHFGQFVAGSIYNPKLNVKFENWHLLEDMPAPFLIVGNHVNNFDPVMTSSNQHRVIHWVANDAVFRHPFLRWAFQQVQTIPKTKGMSDLDTVRFMHKKAREGGIIGLYPEGQTSWDGLTQPLTPATPKLVKLLKIPVVAVVTKGGYISQPRWVWTKDLRKSRVVLEVKVLISQDEIKSLKVDEIEERLRKGLFNDDFQFQKDNPVKLKSKNRAETLELFTYICPKCKTVDALKSEKHNVRCQSCDWEFTIDEYGLFPDKSVNFPFESLSEWSSWQKDTTSKMVADYMALDDPEEALIHNENLTLLTGKGLVPLRPLCKGDLKLLQDRLEFIPHKGDTMVFPIEELEALSIFKQQKFEFYHEKVLYRFHYGTPRDSAYKWLKFLEEIQFIQMSRKE